MNRSSTRSVAIIATAVAVALALWGLFAATGVELTLKEGGPADEVGVVDVLIASIVGALGAWVAYNFLARRGWARWWPFIGSTALAISVAGPSWLADGEAALALISMHFAVAIVLISGFALFGAGRAASGSRSDATRRQSPARPGAM
ncbi:MAG: hypothetical protein GEU75_01425 [Dehalococcoidia bacterium]|nr:hypothetical protein [Dehalococcoidia bacterium]